MNALIFQFARWPGSDHSRSYLRKVEGFRVTWTGERGRKEAEPGNRAAAELDEAHKKTDDAYDTLPLQVRRPIVTYFAGRKRLDQPAEGALPRVLIQVIGRAGAADGRVLRRINVHSRRFVPDIGMTMAYDTTTAVDDKGHVECLS